MDINRSTCNDQECLNILNHNWKPLSHHVFLYRRFGKKQRRCMAHMMEISTLLKES